MVLGCALEQECEELAATRRLGWELIVLGAIFLIGGFAFEKALGGGSAWVLVLGLAFALYGAWCLRPQGLTSARMLALHAACLVLLSLAAHRAATPGKDVAPLVAKAPKDAQWISYGVYFQGLPLHAKRRVTVLNGTGELAYGKEKLSLADQERWFPEDSQKLVEVASRLQREAPERPVFVLAKPRTWKDVKAADRAAFSVEGEGKDLVLARLR